jgi:hypothetical protein
MKHLVWIPFALLLGLLIGGWGPREELREARREIERLRSTGTARPDVTVRAVADLVRINPPLRPDPGPDEALDVSPDSTDAPPTDDGAPSPDGAPDPPPAPRDAANETDLRRQIDAAMEVWRIRSELAREAFLSESRMGDVEAVQFDVLMATMNLRLRDAVERVAERIRAGEPQTPSN